MVTYVDYPPSIASLMQYTSVYSIPQFRCCSNNATEWYRVLVSFAPNISLVFTFAEHWPKHSNLRLDVEVYKEQLESMFLDSFGSTWVDEMFWSVWCLTINFVFIISSKMDLGASFQHRLMCYDGHPMLHQLVRWWPDWTPINQWMIEVVWIRLWSRYWFIYFFQMDCNHQLLPLCYIVVIIATYVLQLRWHKLHHFVHFTLILIREITPLGIKSHWFSLGARWSLLAESSSWTSKKTQAQQRSGLWWSHATHGSGILLDREKEYMNMNLYTIQVMVMAIV